jgi:hypothetical protein
MWQRSLPAPDLRALLLLDRSPEQRHSPFNHLGCLRGLISVTAFVDTGNCSLMAFKFAYNNGDVRTVGNTDLGAVRLSYYFTEGEVITSIGCAKANTNPGIAIKVTQTGSL